MSSVDSEMQMIQKLQQGGSPSAETDLWDRYVKRIAAFVHGELLGTRAAGRETQDVALSVFEEAFQKLRSGNYEWVNDRTQLVKFLLMLAKNQARDERKYRGADLRSELREGDHSDSEFDWKELAIAPEPTADQVASFNDLKQQLLNILSEEDHSIAARNLACQSKEEIADALGVSTRTIERKLRRILDIWKKWLSEQEST